MLSLRALAAISHMMHLGTFLKIFPFGWDPVKFRLREPSRIQRFLFKFVVYGIYITAIFVDVRYVQTMKDHLPTRLRIMHLIWFFASALAVACIHQFDVRQKEIMYFVNVMFEGIELLKKENSAGISKTDSPKSKTAQHVSAIVIVSLILVYVNPPAHAAVWINGVCSPQYISSILHNCASPLDSPITFLEGIPYFIYENVVIWVVLYAWTFNWTIVFVALIWIKEILDKQMYARPKSVEEFRFIANEYRRAQVLTILLNDAFIYYLSWFPSTYFPIVAFMVYSCIRYHYLGFLSYMVFPFCVLRCLFEGITVFEAAGNLSQGSLDYLFIWKTKIGSIPKGHDKGREYVSALQKSFPPLRCTAGSLYTFENSIVLVSLDNCTQLTFNLLVSYPD